MRPLKTCVILAATAASSEYITCMSHSRLTESEMCVCVCVCVYACVRACVRMCTCVCVHTFAVAVSREPVPVCTNTQGVRGAVRAVRSDADVGTAATVTGARVRYWKYNIYVIKQIYNEEINFTLKWYNDITSNNCFST